MVEPPLKRPPAHGRSEILAITLGVLGAFGVVAYGYIASKRRAQNPGCEVETFGQVSFEDEDDDARH